MDILIPPDQGHGDDRRRVQAARAVQHVYRTFANDDHLLHHAVAAGPREWRETFLAAMRHLDIHLAESVADALFEALCERVRRRFMQEAGFESSRTPGAIATDFLDHTPPPARAPTARAIIDSLEIDSASSDDGRRETYGRDGSPQRTLELLKDEARQALRTDGTLPEDFVGRPLTGGALPQADGDGGE